MSKKKQEKVPTATNSIVCSNDVAQQGWFFSARSRKCSDYKHTEHQRGLMLPSSSTALHPSLVLPPRGQSRFPFSRNVGLGISCHSQVRTGLLPAGTEHKLGVQGYQTFYCCSNATAGTSLYHPFFLDKILHVLDEK